MVSHSIFKISHGIRVIGSQVVTVLNGHQDGIIAVVCAYHGLNGGVRLRSQSQSGIERGVVFVRNLLGQLTGQCCTCIRASCREGSPGFIRDVHATATTHNFVGLVNLSLQEVRHTRRVARQVFDAEVVEQAPAVGQSSRFAGDAETKHTVLAYITNYRHFVVRAVASCQHGFCGSQVIGHHLAVQFVAAARNRGETPGHAFAAVECQFKDVVHLCPRTVGIQISRHVCLRVCGIKYRCGFVVACRAIVGLCGHFVRASGQAGDFLVNLETVVSLVTEFFSRVVAITVVGSSRGRPSVPVAREVHVHTQSCHIRSTHFRNGGANTHLIEAVGNDFHTVDAGGVEGAALEFGIHLTKVVVQFYKIVSIISISTGKIFVHAFCEEGGQLGVCIHIGLQSGHFGI